MVQVCPKGQPDQPHDYRARHQPDGSYRAVCELCWRDAGEVDTTSLDVVYGVGYFRKPAP